VPLRVRGLRTAKFRPLPDKVRRRRFASATMTTLSGGCLPGAAAADAGEAGIGDGCVTRVACAVRVRIDPEPPQTTLDRKRCPTPSDTVSDTGSP
jgi:hypothetical protein